MRLDQSSMLLIKNFGNNYIMVKQIDICQNAILLNLHIYLSHQQANIFCIKKISNPEFKTSKLLGLISLSYKLSEKIFK